MEPRPEPASETPRIIAPSFCNKLTTEEFSLFKRVPSWISLKFLRFDVQIAQDAEKSKNNSQPRRIDDIAGPRKNDKPPVASDIIRTWAPSYIQKQTKRRASPMHHRLETSVYMYRTSCQEVNAQVIRMGAPAASPLARGGREEGLRVCASLASSRCSRCWR